MKTRTILGAVVLSLGFFFGGTQKAEASWCGPSYYSYYPAYYPPVTYYRPYYRPYYHRPFLSYAPRVYAPRVYHHYYRPYGWRY
jgi:hypothetical protein